jgi:hypothetical protein
MLIIGIIFVIVIVSIFIYKLYEPKIKGMMGELRVEEELERLQDDEYEVINDILISTKKGSIQIDHIVVSKYGIFVIESKNYTGWIHGNENSEYWTQSIYAYKTQFRNPIKQNWSHIYALKDILKDYKQVRYHPIVVFAGSAELKNVFTKTPVIYTDELFKTIMDERSISHLQIEQVKKIAQKIREANIQDKKARKEHLYRVQDRAYERQLKEESLICPKCGADLVVREGPYGDFYGCSNYPQCKYTTK